MPVACMRSATESLSPERASVRPITARLRQRGEDGGHLGGCGRTENEQPAGAQAVEGRAQAHPGGLREYPGRDGEQHRLGSRRDWESASDSGADDRADAHCGQPARHTA